MATRSAGRPSAPTATEDPERAHGILKMLGPGLVTGASDDDPSGIATYSQVGAQFGYTMLWSVVFTYPLMTAVQEISARIGRITGRGLAGNLRRHYSRWLLYPIVILLLVANTINLGADIGAMGAACKLLIGGPAPLYAVGFAVLSVLLQVFVSYTRDANLLKWLTLVVFSYVVTAFVERAPWGAALRGAVTPTISLEPSHLAALVAVLGTTISPYLFFWQASQESEEVKVNEEEEPLKKAPEQARVQLRRIRIDTAFGMLVSNVVAFFIILSAAVTLHAHGVTDIQTSAQAAEALKPIAGRFASTLFALGIVGTGLLAVPVLAGSAAYAVGEALKWPVGLERKPLDARGFYAVLSVATLLGLGIVLVKLDPIKALFWSAVINGVVAVPVMVVLMQMASNPKVMGKFVVTGRTLRAVGWLATAVMAAASVGLFATMR
jgi:NRAMP (natural resistance-associated macrophage protein)-like metal ion transporter